MTPLRDDAGRAVLLGAEIGRGGEAVIFEVAARPAVVAKLWHDPAAHDRAAKLTWMLVHPPAFATASAGHASLAWPTSRVVDAAGTVRGFLMPRLAAGWRLFEVFNPVRRRAVAPDWDGRAGYRAARNLASVLDAVHAAGYVVGDLNESNVLVTPAALVGLVDADSFQVRAVVDGREVVYPCRVGKPEYLPPELQGRPLDAERGPETDRFALGVLVFQLLMDGNHPFRARWTGRGEPPSLEHSIRRRLYPHAGSHRLVAPPPGVVPLRALDPALAALFARCFRDGGEEPAARPTANEWAMAVAAAETRLVACPAGHWYDRDQAVCPACALAAAAARVRARRSRPKPAPRHRPAAVAPASSTRRKAPRRASTAPSASVAPPVTPTWITGSPLWRWMVATVPTEALMAGVVLALFFAVAGAQILADAWPRSATPARSAARTADPQVAPPTPHPARADDRDAAAAFVPRRVLLEEEFAGGRGRIAGGVAGGDIVEGDGYLHLAVVANANPVLWTAAENLDPAGGVAAAVRVEHAEGPVAALLVVRGPGGEGVVLAVEPAGRRCRLGAIYPGETVTWSGEPCVASDPIRSPAIRAEVRVVGGDATAIVGGAFNRFPPGAAPAPPFRVQVGVGRLDGRDGGWVRIGHLRLWDGGEAASAAGHARVDLVAGSGVHRPSMSARRRSRTTTRRTGRPALGRGLAGSKPPTTVRTVPGLPGEEAAA